MRLLRALAVGAIGTVTAATLTAPAPAQPAQEQLPLCTGSPTHSGPGNTVTAGFTVTCAGTVTLVFEIQITAAPGATCAAPDPNLDLNPGDLKGEFATATDCTAGTGQITAVSAVTLKNAVTDGVLLKVSSRNAQATSAPASANTSASFAVSLSGTPAHQTAEEASSSDLIVLYDGDGGGGADEADSQTPILLAEVDAVVKSASELALK